MNLLKATNRSMTSVNILAMCSVGIAPFAAYYYSGWGYVLAAIVVWQVFNILGISVGAHRYFSHKAFECNRFWQWTMAHLCMVSLVGPPCIWAEAHVRHHKESDKEGDPYLRFALDGDSAVHHTTKVGLKFLRKVAGDPIHRLTLQYYWLFVIGHVVALGLIALVAGLNVAEFIFWLYIVPAGASQLTLRFILWTGHVKKLGYRNYPTPDFTNNWWFASLIAAGEGWHNNHHYRPGAARLGVKWWEFDPGWWVIKAIRQ